MSATRRGAGRRPARRVASAVALAAVSLGFAPDRFARVDDWARELVARGERAGVSVLVSRHGKVVVASSYGYADVANQRPMRPDTIVRLYSMTKPVTSVAVMMLYEEGKLQLDDPIGRYLPELASLEVLERQPDGTLQRVPARRAVTIHHLLTHTSGLSYAYPPEAGYRREDIIGSRQTLASMIPNLAKVPLLFQPGEGWNYGTSTDVLARLVEVVSGMSYDRFLQQRLFAPLAMKDTGFRVSAAQRPRFAEVYTPDDAGRLMLATRAAPQSGPWDGDGSFLAGGGGLVSTAQDYLRFCQMLAGGGLLDGVRILAPSTVRYMLASHVPLQHMPPKFTGPGGAELFAGHGFGLGFAVLLDPVRHGVAGPATLGRWGGLAGTTFWVDPENQLAVVFMSQYLPRSASRIERDLQALVYQAMTD
jgi:CubicO group peptidase (beta-lactamase class C family)